RRLDDKSRMNREIHVRIRESVRVQFPCATRRYSVRGARGFTQWAIAQLLEVMQDLTDRNGASWPTRRPLRSAHGRHSNAGCGRRARGRATHARPRVARHHVDLRVAGGSADAPRGGEVSRPTDSPELTAIRAAGYTPDREGIHPQQHLESFNGTLQADAYSGYQAIYETGRVAEAACWAHDRTPRVRKTLAVFADALSFSTNSGQVNVDKVLITVTLQSTGASGSRASSR
ncbi:transposase IS66 family protein, partial [Paraburkholderia silvatlantica]